MKKVNVIGTSGSGKSTFSKALARRLNAPYIEMDRVYWLPRWQEPSDEVFFSALEQELGQSTWVLDGNYSSSTDIKWAHVDLVVWLDYSLIRTVLQAFKRAVYRCVTRVELWGKEGNVESFRRTFFSKDSILLWTLQNHASNRKRYARLFDDPSYAHIKFVRLTSPKQAKRFLRQLNC